MPFPTGKSDSGGFAALLACEAADRFAAIAPVAGAFYPVSGGCRPVRPVSILEFHGTADSDVPITGSALAWLARRPRVVERMG